jgi:hypothetical protein
MRAKLVAQAEQWRWTSAWSRNRQDRIVSVCAWPLSAAEVSRNGTDAWVNQTVRQLQLQTIFRCPGRPREG